MPARRFTDEQEQEICRRYLAGENGSLLGKAFGVSKTCIHNIVRRKGQRTRSTKESLGGLTNSQERKVIQDYKNGFSTRALSRLYGVSATTIRVTLKRYGIEARMARSSESKTLKKANKKQTKIERDQQKQICRRYQMGETSAELAKAYGVSATTVTRLLRLNGIRIRQRGGRNSSHSPLIGFTDTKSRNIEICREYEAGESSSCLADKYGIAPSTVLAIARRNGTAKRHQGARRSLSGSQIDLICSRYQAGESTHYLARVFRIGRATIPRILRRNGVQLRDKRGWGDTIQCALDGTGRHHAERECEFYLVELARYSATHCKPGIAFDVDRRADEEYGEETLRLIFSTRAEAYFLEQAVLDATRGSAGCPDDLQGWAGASEVRAMPAQDMLPIVLRLADELEELGMWEFAARYCPMTAAQRATCQQRALVAQEAA